MIVAIDGPAGVGKSTIAACVAGKTNFIYINSGYFYRLVTKDVLDSGRDPENTNDIINTARECTFAYYDVEDDTHTDSIDKWVSVHSSIPQVRDIVNRKLKSFALKWNIIVEGRDMGTEVFPDADVKIYLDASLEIRSLRRFRQGVSKLSEKEILTRLKERDYRDMNKPMGRLEKSPDARYIDTSDLTIGQVCEKVVWEIHKKGRSKQEQDANDEC